MSGTVVNIYWSFATHQTPELSDSHFIFLITWKRCYCKFHFSAKKYGAFKGWVTFLRSQMWYIVNGIWGSVCLTPTSRYNYYYTVIPLFQWLSIIDYNKLKSLREMSLIYSLHRTLTEYYYVFNTVSDASKTEILRGCWIKWISHSRDKIMKNYQSSLGAFPTRQYHAL